jgi:WD40 repeat protein
MKRIYFTLLLLPLFIASCINEDEIDYKSLLKGKWVNILVDYQPVQTDAAFYCDYNTDNTQVYAIGYKIDANNKTWIENDKYTYSVKKNLITIDGPDYNGDVFHMVFEILLIDENYMTYKVNEFSINNKEYPDAKIYTCKRITEDFTNKIKGFWYGKCTSAGSPDTAYHYWEYLSEGKYNYYFKDANGKWTGKSDNDGKYFLYGNLFVSTYSNDLITGGKGKTFECWNIEINDNKMQWTGLRDNSVIVKYGMEKVSFLPAIR